jgi:hypothetical protein
MNVTSVESTTLAAIAYDAAANVLQLEFRSLAVYQYFGVPVAVYEELRCAASKGSHFNRVIRGRFPYRLILNPEGTTGGALRSEGAR